jgi:hypothetical protein
VHQYHLTEQALLMVGMPHHVLQSLRFCELYKSTGIINIPFFPLKWGGSAKCPSVDVCLC